jgi:NAD(P)-dependent dehydrogenase (short-subunit alcohol dehydrogenase family)
VRLDGERALVTGSTAGIGAAIARRFAAEGAAVCITGRDEARGAALVGEIEAAGGAAVFVPAALDTEGVCPTLVRETVRELGGLTVLVNNAAATGHGDGPAATLTDDAWDAAFRLNATVPFQLCRAAIPHMLDAGHGAIVNISTRQAERASKGFTAYVASKSAMNGLTRAIAVDYAADNIRCNTISPGYVVNERRDANLDDEPERRARYEAMHLTRLGVADDVAHAAVYLASSESGFLTGINLQLDGGSSIARGVVLG